MKCIFLESDFRPAFHAMLPPGITDALEAWDHPGWLEDVIRIEVAGATMTMVGPYGERTIPAAVETPGVLFCPIRYWMDALRTTWMDEPDHELSATPDYVDTRYTRFLTLPWMFEVFDDVTTAPRTWTLEEPSEDSDEEFFDSDAVESEPEAY